jgi:hypothetical protein
VSRSRPICADVGTWLRANGHGPVKNEETKEHPCFVPYVDLSDVQRAKDSLFVATVRAMLLAFDGGEGGEGPGVTRIVTMGEAEDAAVGVVRMLEGIAEAIREVGGKRVSIHIRVERSGS